MDDQDMLLEQVHRSLSSIKHDINNPVSVISGNAQLLMELARADELDDYMESLRDIDEAAAQISGLLEHIDTLRARLEARGVTGRQEQDVETND